MKRKHIMITCSTFAVAIASIFLFNSRAEAKTLELVETVASNVDALYSDGTKTMLAEDATMENVVAIESDIEEIEKSEELTQDAEQILSTAKEDLAYAKSMVDLRDSTEGLFDENGRLIDDADIATVQKKADELTADKPEFVASIQPLIIEANAQQSAITATNALFTDETRKTVRNDVTRDEYHSAVESVELVTTETVKTKLFASLDLVNTYLTEQEEAEAEAKAEKEAEENSTSSSNKGVKTVSNPSDILVLVNKENALPMDYVPANLVVPDVPMAFSDTSLDKAHLRPEAANALEDLFAAAEADGMELAMVSGYRSAERQEELFEAEVAEDGSEEEALKTVARPGTSEHQTGLAVDVSSPNYGNQLETGFGDTAEGKWLAEHAHEYGFIIRYPEDKTHITKYSYEPWHLRYVGVEAATEMYNNDLCLEEYLGT